MNLSFQASAIDELNQAFEYYQAIDVNLSERFKIEVADYLDTIKAFDELFQIRYRKIRVAPLDKFPYAIHYFVKANQIIVIGIKHQRQFYK